MSVCVVWWRWEPSEFQVASCNSFIKPRVVIRLDIVLLLLFVCDCFRAFCCAFEIDPLCIIISS